MYIHSISLKNYKSIGEKKSSIILEPRVTTIIGKNESGKSNVLTRLRFSCILTFIHATPITHCLCNKIFQIIYFQ